MIKRRFFSRELLQSKNQVILLEADENHHLTEVLRVKPNDQFDVFDSNGSEWRAQVHSVDLHGRASIELIEPIESRNQKASYQLIVAQAIPQRGKLDLIAEKAAELGVDILIPMATERTIVQVKSEQQPKVIARLKKIAIEALKQSRSPISTNISDIKTFKTILEDSKDRIILMVDPSAKETLASVTAGLVKSLKPNLEILILIGPEGGFSERELAMAQSKSARFVSLGNNILKTDTAFVTVVSFIKSSFL